MESFIYTEVYYCHHIHQWLCLYMCAVLEPLGIRCNVTLDDVTGNCIVYIGCAYEAQMQKCLVISH